MRLVTSTELKKREEMQCEKQSSDTKKKNIHTRTHTVCYLSRNRVSFHPFELLMKEMENKFYPIKKNSIHKEQ